MPAPYTVFHVLPRKYAEKFNMDDAVKQASTNEKTIQPKPYVVISIGDPNQRIPDFKEDKWRQAFHRIEIHDVDHYVDYYKKNDGGARLFENEDAKSLLDFYETWRDKAPLFLVHCEAGISRSRAVASALALIEGNSLASEKHINEGHVNALVLWKILEEHEKRTEEKIEWPQNLQETFISACEHNESDLRYEQINLSDETNHEPPLCEHCKLPGEPVVLDRLAVWQKQYQSHKTQSKSR